MFLQVALGVGSLEVEREQPGGCQSPRQQHKQPQVDGV